MAVPWQAKVEYVVDKTDAIIPATSIQDLNQDECPSYDPKRVYRAFWSPVAADSPETMLERVPEIPILTEDDEKAYKPGYYRAHILAIHDCKKKFEDKRTVRQTLRGTSTNKPKDRKCSRKVNGGDEDSGKQLTKAGLERAMSKAASSNMSRHDRNMSIFSSLDNQLNSESGAQSDDSTSDHGFVPDSQLKVMKSSLKNLKRKLLEKCDEVEMLEKKLQAKDDELEKLRSLNRDLQESVLEKVSAMLSSSRGPSLNSSRSSSVSSFASLKSLHSRSRSVSSSSSCSRGASPVQVPSSHHYNKRKFSQPTSPVAVAKRLQMSHLNDSSLNMSTESISPIQSTGFFDDSGSSMTIVPSSFDGSVTMSVSEVGNAMDHSADMNTTQETNCDNTSESDPTDTASKEPVEGTVSFCPGVQVDEKKLSLIEARALGKSNDATYVKDLAVCIFGHKVLYNSCISERKYSKTKDVENQKIRKKLNVKVLEEIAERLKKRVEREFNNGPIPSDQQARFKLSTTNRFIYDKIKKMRQNYKLSYLDDKDD